MLDTPDLSGRVAFVTGTTRGIGKALALSLADCGATVVSTGKTTEADETDDTDLPGSVEATAREIRERGVESLAVPLDVRDEEAVRAAVGRTVEEFGRVDVLINNAGTIQLSTVEEMPADRFDLMMDVNARAAYVCSRAVLPHMKDQGYGHVLMASPPIRIERAPGKAAYALSKLGMTFLALSLAEEVRGHNVGVNALWPVTAIDSRATRYFGMGIEEDWRTPEILCDAVREIVRREPSACTGNAFYDEEVLRAAGVEDFSRYAVVEGTDPAPNSALLFDPTFDREA